MTEEHAGAADSAAELRNAFDRSFAMPPAAAPDEAANFLGITIGASAYLLELSEITALFADTRIVPLPGAAGGCLGVAMLRGDVVAVYSLRALLGHATGDEQPRWLALAGRGPVAAFAFDKLEGHLRIPRADISLAQDATPHGHIRASAVIEGSPRPIIGVHALMDHLEQRLDPNSRPKEH
jgi:chemotaxis signal transduction protein